MTHLTPHDEAILGAAQNRVNHPDSTRSIVFIAAVAAAVVLMKSLRPGGMTSEAMEAVTQHLEENLVVVLGSTAARVVLRITQEEGDKLCS